MKIWTFTEAAAVLGLQTSSGVTRRIQALERRGEGLTIAAGEFVMYGGRRVLTDKGVEKLRRFVGGKSGRRVDIEPYEPNAYTTFMRTLSGCELEEIESVEGIKGWDI